MHQPSRVMHVFNQDHVGTLAMDTVLDSTHCKLRGLEKRVYLNTFHVSRLKLALVSTPSGKVYTQLYLDKAM